MATDINWPFTTGPGKCWLLSDNGYTPADLIERIETPAGSDELAIGTTGPDTFSGSVILSSADHALFVAWLRYTLKLGRLFFLAPVAAAGTIEPREIKFIPGSISYQFLGNGWWRVTASFETRVGTEMSEANYEAMSEVGFAAYYEMMLAAAIAMNTEIAA